MSSHLTRAYRDGTLDRTRPRMAVPACFLEWPRGVDLNKVLKKKGQDEEIYQLITHDLHQHRLVIKFTNEDESQMWVTEPVPNTDNLCWVRLALDTGSGASWVYGSTIPGSKLYPLFVNLFSLGYTSAWLTYPEGTPKHLQE